MKKEIKISYKKEIKRFEIPQTFKELKETIQKCFKQFANADFVLTYVDDEQDYVVISNDFDLEQVNFYLEKEKLGVLKAFIDFAPKENSKPLSETVIVNSISNDMIPVKDEPVKVQEPKKEEAKTENSHNQDLNNSINNNQFVLIQKENLENTIIVQKPDPSKPEEVITMKNGNEDEKKEEKVKVVEENKFNNDELVIIENPNKTEANNKENLLNEKTNTVKIEFPENLEEIMFKSMNKGALEKSEFTNNIELENKNTDNQQNGFGLNKEVTEFIKRQNEDLKMFMTQMMEQKLESIKESISNSFMRPSMSLQESKVLKKIIHLNTKCCECGATPIVGILYKSSVVSDFILCENCEENTSHPHPMIKIKNPFVKKINEEEKQIPKELIKKPAIINRPKLIIKESFEIGKQSKELRVPFEIKNEGETEISNYYFINEGGLFAEKAEILKLEPGVTIKKELIFNTLNLEPGQYKSMWKLISQENNSNIEQTEIIIKVNENKKIMNPGISEVELRVGNKTNSYRFYHKLVEFKMTYGIGMQGGEMIYSNERILEVLEKNNGDFEKAIIELVSSN